MELVPHRAVLVPGAAWCEDRRRTSQSSDSHRTARSRRELVQGADQVHCSSHRECEAQ